MKKVLLIGNTGKNKVLNGQTIKVRLYKDLLIKENVDFNFVDLKDFSHHPISSLIKIKKYIKDSERIVLITAQRGVKVLIPFINSCNKKYKRPFILPMIGINILHKYTDDLNEEDHYSFMHDCNFKGVKPSKKDTKQLQKITYILPENEMIKKVLVSFFKLENVEVLQNFRDSDFECKNHKRSSDALNIIFLSRVMRNKGVFELIDAVKEINEKETLIKLDIYGEKYMDSNDSILFDSLLDSNVTYQGPCSNDKVIGTISLYDLFVFPTLFKSEGTPGVIAESFIAGVPVLSSNFTQAPALMTNGVDSIIYEPSTRDELKNALINILKERKHIDLAKNVINSRKKYFYTYNRELYLKYICGLEK